MRRGFLGTINMQQITNKIIKNQEDNETIYPLSFFANVKSPESVATFSVTWKKLCKNLTSPIISPEKDCPLFGPYSLGPHKTRRNSNVVEVSLLVFDIDDSKGMSAKDIIKLVNQYDAIIHSTWTHTIENPKYRLIIRLLKPVAASEFKTIRDTFLSLNPALESIVDKACSDPSRSYYLYSYPIERSGFAEHVINDGISFDPSGLKNLSHTNQLSLGLSALNNPSTIPPSSVLVGGRNNALTKYIGSLIGKGYNNSVTLTEALNWNLKLPQPLDDHEVLKTHDSIWKTHLRNNPNAIQTSFATTKSTNNFQLISAGKLLASPPQARSWLIKDFLPSNIVAALIAAGGTGKSYLAMHIAVSAASGSSLFGKFIPSKTAKVVFISGEDDETEIKRRLHAVTQGMPIALKTNVDNNLNFIDLADDFALFTQKPASGEVQITDVPVKLVDLIKQSAGDSIDLIIVDPVSRFRGGEENSASDTTRFVQSLQHLRDHLGATVLALHHVNKGAKTNGTSQNNSRGSSAFIDGVRLVYELNALSDSEIEKAYGQQIIMPRVVTLNSVKSNYGVPIDPLILCKRTDGSLEQFGMKAGQHQNLAILQEIKINPMAKTQFKKAYGSASGKFGLSEKALVKKLEDLQQQGLLTIPTRGLMQLTANGITLVGP